MLIAEFGFALLALHSLAKPEIVWDSPRLKMAIVESPKDPHGVRFLARFKPGTNVELRREPIGMVGIDGLVGNPEKGPFALQSSFVGPSVESYRYRVFTKSMKTLSSLLDRIWSISPYGVIGGTGSNYQGDLAVPNPVLVVVNASGRIAFKKPQWDRGASWYGGRVLMGRSLLDRRTGKRLRMVSDAIADKHRPRWLRVPGT